MLNALQGLLNRQGVLRFDPFGTGDGSGGDRRGRNRGNRRNDGGRNRNGGNNRNGNNGGGNDDGNGNGNENGSGQNRQNLFILLIVTIVAVVLGVGAGALGGIIQGLIMLFTGENEALWDIGSGVFLAGVTMLWWKPALLAIKYSSVGLWTLCKKCIRALMGN